MKKTVLPSLLLLLVINTYGQINVSDSTTQVIGYWDKNETQTYNISYNKVKIKDGDTISKDLSGYKVDISIQDSSETEYLIDWHYRDFSMETDNALMKKLASLNQDMTVRIKTDALGTFIEVVNWEELRDYIIKGISMLKDEMKDIPNMDMVISQVEDMYSSKEAIEAGAINEILQFYYFHGVKYKLLEETSYDNQLANMLGGNPFDTRVTFWLDEINSEDNNAVYRMHQAVDSVQLTNETFKYLTKMAEALQVPGPKREEFPYLKNETWLASRIHGAGWVIYSVQTKEVMAENIRQVEECIIKLE